MAKKCNCKLNSCNCNKSYLTYSCNSCDSLSEVEKCDIQVDSKNIIYHSDNCKLSKLYALNFTNGTDLEKILESIDIKFNSTFGYNFDGFSLYCVEQGLDIKTIKDFAEAISLKFCQLKANNDLLSNDYSLFKDKISEDLNNFNYLNLNKRCIINLLLNDNIRTVLQKIVDYICTLSLCSGNSTSSIILYIFSNTLSIEFLNVNSSIVSAKVKISSTNNNCLELKEDGLYVQCLDQDNQTLSYNEQTNLLSISNGNSIELLALLANQTLSFDSNSKNLSISNGNSVNLGSLTNTNIIDEKVKSHANDLSAGYLFSKLNGLSNIVSINTATNTSTNKIDIGANLNLTSLVNLLISNLTLIQSIAEALKLYINCFKFKITNTDTSSHTYSYVQCDNTLISNINIGLSGTVEICALSVSTSDLLVSVQILGNC